MTEFRVGDWVLFQFTRGIITHIEDGWYTVQTEDGSRRLTLPEALDHLEGQSNLTVTS